MSRDRQILFWLIGIVVFGMLLYLLRGVLMPFVAGMAVAYFLDPLADKLEAKGAPRWLATTLITAAFVVVTVILLLILVPVLQAQIVDFATRVPDYAGRLQKLIQEVLAEIATRLPPEQVDSLREAVSNYGESVIGWIGKVLKGVLSGGVALFDILSLLLLTPVVAFYLLRDWDRMMGKVDTLLPRAFAPTIRAQAAEIDRTIAGFVRGQATVCLLLGVFYGIGLSLVGLDFGLLVGLGTGLLSFIPYFGMLVGLVVGFSIALVQFSDWLPIFLVAGVFAVGQVMEGNFLTPKLVGDRVGLHPVWVIFALLVGGSLFGFTGVMLAVPVAAVIGVLVRFTVSQYVDSPLYGGAEAEAEPGEGR